MDTPKEKRLLGMSATVAIVTGIFALYGATLGVGNEVWPGVSWFVWFGIFWLSYGLVQWYRLFRKQNRMSEMRE